MTQLVFIDAKWDGEIELTQDVIDYLKNNNVKTLALFASTQFTKVDKLKEQLHIINIEVKTTKAKRTNTPMQILGCDLYHDSFEEDIMGDSDMVMYVGDGLFHPKALLLSQIKNKEIKPLLLYDPMAKEMQILNEADITNQIQRTKRNLKMFISSRNIGILVTVKPGQQYFNAAKRLKEFLEKQNKKAYIFIDDSIDLNALENYPFIDSWVNTACPRIGSDDLLNTNKVLINLREAGNPIKALEELQYRN